MNGIRPIMSTGIPELDPPVLPMDPMAIDKVPLFMIMIITILIIAKITIIIEPE